MSEIEKNMSDTPNRIDLTKEDAEKALKIFAWFVKWGIESSSEFVTEFIEERREEIENFCENHQLALCTLIASEKWLWKALVAHDLLPTNPKISEIKAS